MLYAGTCLHLPEGADPSMAGTTVLNYLETAGAPAEGVSMAPPRSSGSAHHVGADGFDNFGSHLHGRACGNAIQGGRHGMADRAMAASHSHDKHRLPGQGQTTLSMRCPTDRTVIRDLQPLGWCEG